MEVENLQALLNVVECGSVQSAARAMGMTRSLLRRTLDGLEAEVGVPLLHRDPTGVRLTASGAVLVAQGRTLVDGFRSAITEARAAAQEATGIINVFVPVGMPLTFRVQTLLVAHRTMSRLRMIVRVVEDPASHIRESCELMLHMGPAPDSNIWFSRVLARDRVRAVASPDYLRARGTPLSAAELVNHDTLVWRSPQRQSDAWPLLAGGTVGVCPWLVSTDLLMLHTVAAAGGGILLAPHNPFFDEPGALPLVAVLDDEIGDEVTFRASFRHPSASDSRTREALELLQQVLSGFPEK